MRDLVVWTWEYNLEFYKLRMKWIQREYPRLYMGLRSISDVYLWYCTPNRHWKPSYNRHTKVGLEPPQRWLDQSHGSADPWGGSSQPPPSRGRLWYMPNCFYVDDSFYWSYLVDISTKMSISRTRFSLFFYTLFPQFSPYVLEIMQWKNTSGIKSY